MEESESKRIKLESSPRGISELDVGITCYVCSEVPGFKGSLKQRYTDFLVNEIEKDGNVVHLIDLGVEDKKDRRREKREKEREVKPPPELGDFRSKLEELVGAEVVDKCLELFHTGTKYETEQAFEDKALRTQIHQLFGEAFQGRLDTSTTADKRLIVRLQTRSTRSRVPKSEAGNVLEFLRFTVYKENKETMEVTGLIARFLRIQPKAITFAGTKDRRGVTCQKFSIRRMNVARVSSLNSTLRGVKLGSFQYMSEPIRLGDLNGNQFVISVRNIDNVENVDAALKNLRDNGFINYFGLQRFGTFSVSTHTVGKSILKGDYDAAVTSILQPQELTLPESREAREIYANTKDAAKALELMPRKCMAEYQILTALKESPSSINALLRVPHNLRLMYVHSYQSYVWNCAASERVRRGLEVVPGDLVLDEAESTFTRARPVTAQEIEQKSKTIFDIVLPTPGFDVTYPENLVNFYETIMNEDGIDCHNMRRNTTEFSLSGSYRLLMSRPSDLTWWHKTYTETDEQLVRTDLELLELGKPITPENRLAETVAGERNAVILQMTLGTSEYATMALREAMKTDTSRHGQMFFS
ncbi:Multisubstrate pseudouridine synthase 7 [Wickerhamiella sorbophila]|uniref:Multisubstrate pseudouridine synthase 7 n=1 Tax=Wickerhamiella sorbophila TaxID=45607 RepID=A0A2T0FH14_9ASCO|nr:Multisubstrate pseudouridine synthase 7 [Wickerhamiella sorbophila]PRT54274.1 Multisubstrate pseudouridine synthase 7 [Wickerhamiella sorbophila]